MSNSEMVNQSVRLYQGLHKRHFGANELFRIYLGTPVSHLFKKDNPSGSDISLGYYGNNKKKMICL